MRFLSLAVFFLLLTITGFAQDNSTSKQTLENQFDYLYNTSTNYKGYKVISKEGLLTFKTAILDSIARAKKTIAEKENQILSQNNRIKELQTSITQTKNTLKDSIQKEDSISFLGITFSKIAYNLILWNLISLLIITGTYYFFKFKNSHILTKEAQESHEYVEQEYEEFRKKTLVKEQQLRRQLQDEINKQK